MTISDDALGIYTVTFKAVAKGGKELEATFTFEINCGFPIREYPVLVPKEDPALNLITVYWPLKKGTEEFTLDAYRLTGGHCNI